MNEKIKTCEKCGSTMGKKNSGHVIYYECNYCGKKDND